MNSIRLWEGQLRNPTLNAFPDRDIKVHHHATHIRDLSQNSEARISAK